jgi:hypothetical protein
MNQAISASAAADAESVLYASIRALITSARNTIARGVDLVQVHTNFEIGRHIVEYEQQGETRATYGQELLNRLADRLTAEFGKGFGRSNIAYSRSFYLAYRERRPIVQTASGLLTHQDLGQMQMYVNYFDRYVKTDAESATIGIVLCKKKHEALVEITLPKDANIHAREYQLYLPSKEELQQKLAEWAGLNHERGA